MDKLTVKQKKVLDCLKSSIRAKGYPPTVREICASVGLSSTSTVHGHLDRLEKKGYIRRDRTKPRAIEILDENIFEPSPSAKQTEILVYSGTEYADVPILGKVTAGEPILAVENIEGSFPIPVHVLGNKDAYLLNVSGDSMMDAGILDGDYVLVSQENTAADGEMVVALVGDEEATVKTIYHEGNVIRLQPENPLYQPIIRSEEQVSILGKVIGVIRFF